MPGRADVLAADLPEIVVGSTGLARPAACL
jgi:hypothetical protein